MRLLGPLVLALVLAGCGTQSPPRAAPTPRDPAPTTSPASPSPPPVRTPITRAQAGHVLREMPPLPRFRFDEICLNGKAEGCDLPTQPRWTQYVSYEGRPYLPRHRGQGREWILIGVLAHANARRARTVVRDVRKRNPVGPIRTARVELDDGGYLRAERGRGTTQEVSIGAWRGMSAVSRVRLLDPGDPTVPGIVRVDAAVSRGRFGVQVIAWLRQRPGQPDPAPRIDALTRQVLRQLDAPYAG